MFNRFTLGAKFNLILLAVFLAGAADELGRRWTS